VSDYSAMVNLLVCAEQADGDADGWWVTVTHQRWQKAGRTFQAHAWTELFAGVTVMAVSRNLQDLLAAEDLAVAIDTDEVMRSTIGLDDLPPQVGMVLGGSPLNLIVEVPVGDPDEDPLPTLESALVRCGFTPAPEAPPHPPGT
jgi:hypothetical protein